MARIHSHRHGKSHQTRPMSKTSPTWVTYGKEEVETTIAKLAKDGLTASQIGLALRDDYAVPLVKPLLGKSIGQVLREGKNAPQIPQDLRDLIERAARVQKHLQANKADRKNVHSLELIEAKIYRLVKYYRAKGLLPADFKWTAVVAQLA
ncbi:MAG: 30S ribosomal protein S15 [Nitrososphaerales archaeon]|nr:30S ribosomal protein S15 [Nitrososphaerales archaeon]